MFYYCNAGSAACILYFVNLNLHCDCYD